MVRVGFQKDVEQNEPFSDGQGSNGQREKGGWGLEARKMEDHKRACINWNDNQNDKVGILPNRPFFQTRVTYATLLPSQVDGSSTHLFSQATSLRVPLGSFLSLTFIEYILLSFLSFQILFIATMCVMEVRMCTACVWTSGDNVLKSILSFYLS